jgi:hypothetical protein
MKGNTRQWLKRHLDLALLGMVAAAFAGAAAIRLGTYPVYETDESYTLQVAYEILNRGTLALPMYRFLGGNIDNVWHSFTPLYFFSLSGFLKVFGFGVLQGRIFNLIAALCCLILVYLIGRRLFNWSVGLIAVVMMVSDPTVLQRARMVRNDYPAEALALLAFYLYELAEDRKATRYFIASGLAAGAGMMCHPSILYVVAAIGVLMLLRRGWGLVREKPLYQFAAGVVAVSLYEIAYDAVDYKNLLQQYRGDNLHFGILSIGGLWSNLLDEPTRYIRWYRIYDVTFQTIPLTLLHLFQFLIAAAIVYLIVRTVRLIRPGHRLDEPRTRLLIVTLVAMLFLAFILHKAGYYNIHVITWFSLCVGVFLSDAARAVMRLPGLASNRPVRATATLCIALLVACFATLLGRQYKRYIIEARNPDAASSAEFTAVLSSVVPPNLCPVAVMAPVLWLSFPDRDRCFATLERRMSEAVHIDGQDYALIMRPKVSDHWAWDLSSNRHLLAELIETPYGNFNIYYTGTDRVYLDSPPSRIYFFGQWNGHASQEQVDAARVVWSAGADGPLTPASNQRAQSGGDNRLPESAGNSSASSLPMTIPLKRRTIYTIEFTCPVSSANSELLVTESETGRRLRQIPIVAKDGEGTAADIFRTLGGDGVTLQILPAQESGDPRRAPFSNITIWAVADIQEHAQSNQARANRYQRSGSDLIDGR